LADTISNNTELIDVAVIGGGPSGLAAATALKEAGVTRVVVLEREQQAGGVPRSCGHFAFGLREFTRVLKGPEYAKRLVAQAIAAGVEIQNQTTVVQLLPDGALRLSSPAGANQIAPRRVVYATGVRETSRSSQLISGARVQGVMNTGALQSMVYLKQRRPFSRPIIIGSELVGFSALMTCRHAGIRPVAMIEAAPNPIARWPSALYPRLRGVKLLTNTQLMEIHGSDVVEHVCVAGPDGQTRKINCDGVILSGQFTPEAALARSGHLKVDSATGGPLVDQWGRCSDPTYFATGNLFRPVETAGRSWAEGRQTGRWVALDLAGKLPKPGKNLRLSVRDPRLKYTMPQVICVSNAVGGMSDIQMRVTERISGKLVANTENGPVWSRALNARPERRIEVPIAEIVAQIADGTVEFEIEGAAS